MYGIPEAGRLANDLLIARLKKYGYIKATHTSGYWKQLWKPSSWTLIVDDFGLKYTNKRHVTKLLTIISQLYVMKMDWPGTSFYYTQVELRELTMGRTLSPRIY